jgi:hypothetical protein
MLPEIMWQNPLTLRRANLNPRGRHGPHYISAEQAKKARAGCANRDASHCWALCMPPTAKLLHFSHKLVFVHLAELEVILISHMCDPDH